MSGIRSWGYWTHLWLDFFEAIAKKHGYIATKETPARIDMSWYQMGILTPVAVIEVETRANTIWDSEVRNLFYSSAKLKVLLTYVTDRCQERIVEGLRNAYRHSGTVRDDEEMLVILMIYEEREGRKWFNRWEAHVLRSGGKVALSVKHV
jgi:hypothetical protein